MKINEACYPGDPPLCCSSLALRQGDELPHGGATSFVNAVNEMYRPVVGGVSPVVFEKNLSQLGAAVTHLAGTPEFLLHQPGYYEIFYAALVMSPNSQPVAALLTLNDCMIPGTYSEDTVTDRHTVGSLSGLAVVQVHCPSTVRLVNAAEDTIYSSASLYCRRLC